MTETCPACGAEASGRFCPHCGVALSAACRECGNPLPKGARFCNLCGATAAPPASPATRSTVLPWTVAGIALAALIAVLVVPRLNGRREAAQPQFAQGGPVQAPGAMPQGNPGAVDLSSMTPREAADRLFNRVMTAVSNNDTAQALRFLPMAVAAYQRVDSLDADGRYHLGALELVGGHYDAAKAQADTMLQADPTHLFGLFVAARAEAGRGNAAAAKDFYSRFLAAYDAEIAKKRPEYEEHSQGLPAMKTEAEQATR
jgi:hypothetical protein